MNTVRTTALIALLACTALLPACNADTRGEAKEEAAAQDGGVVGRAISSAITEAVTEARQEIRSGNITISGDDKGIDRPKAEITPKGDLLIEGKAVALDDAQRALLLDYRGHIAAVAESGMEIGLQGADLAQKAVGEAFKGILTGKSEQDIEKSVEAEAAKIKQAAAKLCGKLPAMMASQQKAAAAIPEFRPYATMTQDDIDDCLKDTDKGRASRNAADEAAAATRAN